jgi:hypothetical protein
MLHIKTNKILIYFFFKFNSIITLVYEIMMIIYLLYQSNNVKNHSIILN